MQIILTKISYEKSTANYETQNTQTFIRQNTKKTTEKESKAHTCWGIVAPKSEAIPSPKIGNQHAASVTTIIVIRRAIVVSCLSRTIRTALCDLIVSKYINI